MNARNLRLSALPVLTHEFWIDELDRAAVLVIVVRTTACRAREHRRIAPVLYRARVPIPASLTEVAARTPASEVAEDVQAETLTAVLTIDMRTLFNARALAPLCECELPGGAYTLDVRLVLPLRHLAPLAWGRFGHVLCATEALLPRPVLVSVPSLRM